MLINISIIGTGRVATHLAKALFAQGHRIVQVAGRDIARSKQLADVVDASATLLSERNFLTCDLFIMSISDDALALSNDFGLPSNIPIVHTSGSVGMEILSFQSSHGVFYPLQTFSHDRVVDFQSIPIFIEANNDKLSLMLYSLASSISTKVNQANSAERKQLHLAAVFACNFSNQLFAIAKDILDEKSLSYDWVKPLILETAQKAVAHNPDEVQTGPAVRNDQRIIQAHLQMLNQHPDQKELYELITKMIYKKQS